MTQIEALKLALEALEDTVNGCICRNCINQVETITAIKAALEAKDEPVAQPKVRMGNCLRVGVCASEGHKIQPQRKPLTHEMTKQMRESCDSYEMRGAFVDGWLSAEVAHGIKENT